MPAEVIAHHRHELEHVVSGTLAEERRDILIRAEVHVWAVVPREAVTQLTPGMTAIVILGLENEAAVVTDVERRTEPGNAGAQNSGSLQDRTPPCRLGEVTVTRCGRSEPER